MEEQPRWRWGVNRWLVILFAVLGYFGARAYPPIMPHIQLPGEVLSESPLFTAPVIGEFFITNTLVAMALANIVLIAIALVVRRATREDTLVLSGFAGAIGAMMEALYDLVESSAGRKTKEIFPWVAGIILVVLVVNWMEIFPGVESIGFLHHDDHGYPVQTLAQVGDVEIRTILAEGAPAAPETTSEENLYSVVPWVRISSTDLNFTFAIAIISVFMTQVIGVRALGLSYFTKFFDFGGFFKMWTAKELGPFDVMMPFIDIFVGLLESIAEVAKVISFAFRLFGNIFAGSILLFVIGTLVPVLLQTGVLMLEIFVGLIQALIFGILTLVFMVMATESHDEHGGEHAEAH